jgi:VWFA-related protein
MRYLISSVLAVCLGALVATGCSGLRLQLHNASVQKPSNVALYFAVETRDGKPVPGLTAEMFRIFEDGQLISPFESKQTILNPEVAVVHFSVLLMDLSGSITESGSLPALIEAAATFADRVTRSHQIAVYGFDGGASLIPVVEFTNRASVVKAGLKKLERHKVKDPSTNLNGAVVEAVRVLEQQMGKANQPLRFGTLVVFTDGTDRAHRVSEAQMFGALDAAGVNVFAIGLGGEISAEQLRRLSRTGFVRANDQAQIGVAFDEVASLIEAAARKFYLLSYCSPSRAGTHELTVEAMSTDRSGSLTHSFSADGFGPNCDPGAKPSFPVGRIRLK